MTLKCQGWKGPWRVSGFLGSHTELVAEVGLESRSPKSHSGIVLSLLACACVGKCVCVRAYRDSGYTSAHGRSGCVSRQSWQKPQLSHL